MNLEDVRKGVPRRTRRTRVGRGVGSGLGKTAGRGHKGYYSRSGSGGRLSYEGGQMPLFRRLPKKGFNNQRFRTERTVLNLRDLNRFPEGSTVDLEIVVRDRLARPGAKELRILGKGKLEHRLHVRARHFSKAAREAIEKVGGQAETL